LVQSEKLSAVGQFVAGVAHELNNPLTSVVGYAEILALDPSHAEAKTYLQRIAQAAERCRKIVQNLLGFSRQHPPERRPLRLIEVCDAVLEFLAYEMRHSGVKVEKHFPSDLPRILGDTHQLQQVVLNLVNNARQALEEFRPDGVIRLIAEGDGEAGRVRLRICDNGPGIAPEHRSRLFDPFFTTKAEGKGTGLGLSLCYGLVQEHRGTIVVVSERGQGAEFVLEFPVLGDASAIMAVDLVPVGGSATTFAGMAGKGRAALVIDDEIWIRDVAAEVLRGEGYTVETAESGEDGLGKLREAAYDLVVCDWKMPGLNGMALYERVRAENAEQARGFLFMTGDMVSDGFMTFLRKYNRPCLPKPFAPRELRAAVSKLAAGT
jgi:two-component system, NtrC family, sensor kinase